MPRIRTIIFAKAPRPGLAKTRLIPALGANGAAWLARRMLEHTLANAMAAALGPVELCMTPAPKAPEWRDISAPPGVEVSDQGTGDLGARLARAAQRSIAAGDAVLLIGTDCPALTPVCLRAAAAALLRVGAVIHPTADGGYALLGLTRTDPRLFADIAWSTDAVAAVTLARLDQLGWPVCIAPRLHDIDEPGDLIRLPAEWPATLRRPC
jgi:rSAM/selenodomain-associated transferase 1